MTPDQLLTALIEAARLGTAGLDFWKSVRATADLAIEKVATHDTQLKTAPPPGPKEA